jgi:hypothetical protein
LEEPVTKLTTLVDGDIALLKCNDTFPGNVVLTKAITINSYGTGLEATYGQAL